MNNSLSILALLVAGLNSVTSFADDSNTLIEKNTSIEETNITVSDVSKNDEVNPVRQFANETITEFEQSLDQSGRIQNEEAVYNSCLSTSVLNADDTITVAELRTKCLEQPTDAFSHRRALEESIGENPFALIPYKPNYLLPATYSEGSTVPYAGIVEDDEFDKIEVKFQVSLKYLAFEDVFMDNLDMYVAFTTSSWWQAYNDDQSSPFRESNYEPELMIEYDKPFDLFGQEVDFAGLSLNHQSNGQSAELSRSWNRIIGKLGFVEDNFAWVIRAWWRLPEDSKKDPSDSKGDDNPDIYKYMGYGDLGAVWKLPNNHSFDMTLRNNLRKDNKGAIELGWTFPINKQLHGYVQYFNGYGESLIYYNHSVQRLGIGVKLTNWL